MTTPDISEASLLESGNRELDDLFRTCPPGEVPGGPVDGTAIIAAGTRTTKIVAKLARAVAWRGKVFDPGGRTLTNRVSPWDVRAIKATVYREPSWVDGRECIVIDYSKTSIVARGVRDEIRLVATGLYLGVVWLGKRRVAWFLLRLPPAGVPPRTVGAAQRKTPHQVAVTVRSRLRSGREAEVTGLLDELRKNVDRDGTPFRDCAGVHFARVFLMPGDAHAEDGGSPNTLVYMAEVDAPVGPHLRQLASANGALNALLCLCEGYPDTRSVHSRAQWLRRHRVAPAATYVHRVGRSLPQVRAEAILRERIEDFLDDPAHDWSQTSPTAVHQAVRRFAASQGDLMWALHPTSPPRLSFRIKESLHKIGLPALALVLTPVLLALLPAWAVLIRRLERQEQPEMVRPPREFVAELTKQEDFVTQNPFTAAGSVKPSLVRRITLRVVLAGLDYFNRHVYNRDTLAGVRTIHFARWVPIDGGKRLIFASNYDGSLESYMDDFIDKLSWGLNAVFSNGIGYPSTRWLLFGGARHEQAFKWYLRCHQLPSVWYTAYPDLSARNIDDNTSLHEGLTRELNTEQARSWLALL
jgi:hypothetical protein